MVVFQPRIHANRQMHDFSLTKRKESKQAGHESYVRLRRPPGSPLMLRMRHSWPEPRRGGDE